MEKAQLSPVILGRPEVVARFLREKLLGEKSKQSAAYDLWIAFGWSFVPLFSSGDWADLTVVVCSFCDWVQGERRLFVLAVVLIGVKYLLLFQFGPADFFFLIIRAGIYGLLKCQNKTPSKKQTFRSESGSAKLFNFLLESSPEKKKHRARASREPHKVVNLCTENQNRQKLMGNKQVVKIITNSFYICGRLEGVGLRVTEGKKEPRQQTECGQGCPGCPVQISWVSSTCDIVLVEVRSRV